jgi:hypothetical protein
MSLVPQLLQQQETAQLRAEDRLARTMPLDAEYVRGLMERAASGNFAAQRHVFERFTSRDWSDSLENFFLLLGQIGLSELAERVYQRMYAILGPEVPRSQAAIMQQPRPSVSADQLRRLLAAYRIPRSLNRSNARVQIARLMASPDAREELFGAAILLGASSSTNLRGRSLSEQIMAIWEEYLQGVNQR